MKKIIDLFRTRDKNAGTVHFVAFALLMLLAGAAAQDPHPPVFGYLVMGLAVAVADLVLAAAFVLFGRRS